MWELLAIPVGQDLACCGKGVGRATLENHHNSDTTMEYARARTETHLQTTCRQCDDGKELERRRVVLDVVELPDRYRIGSRDYFLDCK